ncbi:vWA domain-containing protein [Saccharothrix texasensis]|uniref:von Willebrand factor type A domain-containing protein n=1 Tax=Saccharothrix texasensis TaxID=103734 RepID=A0A3N1HHE9_9PSEU|nr:vWA domain-containing protein [Saccharothrix texasensis]ROP41896.1 von Willebrand factor type A domain-containing protein [Saccharothrix texasensis]
MRKAFRKSALVAALTGALTPLLVAPGVSGQAVAAHGAAAALPCPMDVAFLLDTTGSMKNTLLELKAQGDEITTAVEAASGGDYRMGLIGFDTDLTVKSPLTADNKVQMDTHFALLNWTWGGLGLPEASDEALVTAVENREAGLNQVGDFPGPWRPHAFKTIVLITDAKPAGFDDNHDDGDLKNAIEATERAFGEGIRIIAVQVPDSFAPTDALDPEIAAIMNGYSTGTDGQYIGTNEENSADAIRDALSRCPRTDAYIRDVDTDTGVEPRASAGNSPAIRLCTTSTLPSCPPPDAVATDVAQTPVFFHVEVHSPGPKGNNAATSHGVLKLYRSLNEGPGGHWPALWTEIGSKALDVPPNAITPTTAVIPWKPTIGNWTFMARWVAYSDPMAFAEGPNSETNVKNNNNIAWRRIDVTPTPQ